MYQLISSQLDMDRLDYLKRDSFYTGVAEGNVNSERLITMLNVVNDELLVEEKGIYSVEKFLVARRFMYWQVYLHKTVICAEEMLIQVLKRAKELVKDGVEMNASKPFMYFLENNISKSHLAEDELSLKNYSLLDDYNKYSANKINPNSILENYLEVFKLEGTEQNNYKHMMGSCKKILQSLSVSDLNKEWVLRLLKAFSMYSVNNDSYVSEANSELEIGFINLYEDDKFHQNNFDTIQLIFDNYFERLNGNLDPENSSFIDIKLIRAKLLLKMQIIGIDKLASKNLQLKTKLHA